MLFRSVQLAGFSTTEAVALFGAPPLGRVLDVTPWTTAEAEARYLDRYGALIEALKSRTPRP